MFRFTSWIAAFLVLSLGFYWIFYLSSLTSESLSETKLSDLKKTLSSSAVATAEQTRTKVRKDVWISMPTHERLQNRIESESSILTLQPKKNSVEVIERLQNIECWSQEKIYQTNQSPFYQMRVLKAKEGSYKYQSQTFEASQAALSLYKIPGLSLITNLKNHQPFLQGTAGSISFIVQSGVPCFQANEFKASLNQGSRL